MGTEFKEYLFLAILGSLPMGLSSMVARDTKMMVVHHAPSLFVLPPWSGGGEAVDILPEFLVPKTHPVLTLVLQLKLELKSVVFCFLVIQVL